MKKTDDYKKLNHALKLFKVLSNANRLKIAKFLAEAKDSSAIVSDILKGTGVAETNLSNHLKLMRISGILSARQDGTNIYYTIKDHAIKPLLAAALV